MTPVCISNWFAHCFILLLSLFCCSGMSSLGSPYSIIEAPVVHVQPQELPCKPGKDSVCVLLLGCSISAVAVLCWIWHARAAALTDWRQAALWHE